MEVFIVGQNMAEPKEGVVWEIQGVFDTEEKALADCKGPNYFIGPLTMNEGLPEKSGTWPGCYYPAEKGDI